MRKPSSSDASSESPGSSARGHFRAVASRVCSRITVFVRSQSCPVITSSRSSGDQAYETPAFGDDRQAAHALQSHELHRRDDVLVRAHGDDLARHDVADSDLLIPGIVSAWILMASMFVRELTLSVVLSRPGTEVLAVQILRFADDGLWGRLSALGIIMILISTTLVLLATFVGSRFKIKDGLDVAAPAIAVAKGVAQPT